MDAQNAAGPASTKPAASQRSGSDSDQRKTAVNRSPSSTRSPWSSKDAKSNNPASRSNNDDDGAVEGNSDAETIVLPGKDGHSPSKVRKIIKHEDKSDGNGNGVSLNRRQSIGRLGEGDKVKLEKSVSLPGPVSGDGTLSLGSKKKKLHEIAPIKDVSSGLSSAPTSPPPRRHHSESESEGAGAKSPSTSIDRLKSTEKSASLKRKASKPESDDEVESRKIRRQRVSGSGLNASRKDHPTTKTHQDAHTSRTRSTSPHTTKIHRRSISTQLPSSHSSNGLGHKKRKIPAPLQSTDYHSDESSAGGSPHPRSSKLRSLTTPATMESTMSPAKMAPHKKHLDAHGQTFLARACAKGEYDVAKQRLQERPDDVNIADYAGNTPLQIAALNGFDDIVKLLVDAGCNLDCVNNDKDTPLLDAVENGHLEVVRILLDAGVNPRKANAYGEEPELRVNEEDENAPEIRKALKEAKLRMSERRPTSEDHQLDNDARSSHGPDSPRRSPGATSSIHALASGRRAGTSRATKTSNHLLYAPLDDKTLRAAAGRGDEELVTRILQIRDTCDDPDSMVAAARGGHDIVMQLFLALGKANPDPPPISPSNEFSTPMLAAIGQENLKVVRLLLEQADFDPTRRFKGETYYDIARRRRGPNWMEEETLLKDAYDAYKKSHKDISKTKSPNKREQDRRARPEQKEKDQQSNSHKRKTSSPTRETKKANSAKTSSSPREKTRSNSIVAQPDDPGSPQRVPARSKKDDRERERDRIPTIAISDREVSPTNTKHSSKAKRTESDLAIMSSEGETVKPRRKLISGRELKGGKEKERRASITSNASSLKEPSSPRDSRQDEQDKSQKAEKYHDRTKALKRDESRDRLTVSGENLGKRHRLSATPPHSGSADKDVGENLVKRRKLDVDGREKRAKSNSADDRQPKVSVPRDLGAKPAPGSIGKQGLKNREGENRKGPGKPKKVTEASQDRGPREPGKPLSLENSIHVKSEDGDVEMREVEPAANAEVGVRTQADKQRLEEEKRRQAELETQASAKKEEERKRREEEVSRETLRLEEEAKRKAAEEQQREEEHKRKEESERSKREEEERRRREEGERKRKEEEERKRREAEEGKRREEEARKRREEEEERRRREEAEETRRRELEARKKREEEERLRREQLAREAEEEARRKKEEEDRRREEMEQARRIDERRRAEQERIRVSKLPPLLRWLEIAPNLKSPDIAEKFSVMQGVRFDCIRPETTGTPNGREQWLLNTQVALLLGQKDCELPQYTAWERVPVSMTAKKTIWRLEGDRYALTNPSLYHFGLQLPDYYDGEDPERMSYRVSERLRAEAWEKFAAMELFFVKAAELMFIVPSVHHLRNVKLTMAYRELPVSDAQNGWMPLQKWKNDPDAGRFYGFAPSSKYFINGELVHEDSPGLCPVSSSPFPEKRVPRKGLTPVSPNDPDYAKLCREQGLDHLLAGGQSPMLPNGVHSSPASATSHANQATSNGVGSPAAVNNTAVITNGLYRRPLSPASESSNTVSRPLVNGIHGTMNGTSD